MLESPECVPIASRRLIGGQAAVTGISGDLFVAENLSYAGWLPGPKTVDLLSQALDEILQTVTQICGAQSEGDAAAVELWIDRTLMLICVRFRGAPLPGWMIEKWHRGLAPAVLSPGRAPGHRWLLVRDAFESVSHA